MLHDGDTVELGGSKLVAHLTPGRTKGCTTWTMQVREDGRALNVVVVGSPNVNGMKHSKKSGLVSGRILAFPLDRNARPMQSLS